MSTTPVLTVENVRGLPTETKRQLLAMLAHELMDASGTVSVTDAIGEIVVYTVPADAKARAERAIREMTPERRAELQRRAATPDNSVSLDEVLGALDTPEVRNR